MPANMPDIANTSAPWEQGTLDWVGMDHIELPMAIALTGHGAQPVSVKASAYVNLTDPSIKGIHMSRLYLALDALAEKSAVTAADLRSVLDEFASSHHDIADAAMLTLSFDLNLRRRSLLSGKQGYKAYPIVITARLMDGTFSLETQLDITYSSTCPCSAALARQLIQNAFDERFNEDTISKAEALEWLGTTQGINATPHSQRSVANIKLKLGAQQGDFDFVSFIDAFEDALKTPVQAAVKREDEQEFARLNGQNLMFCEDAARKLKHALNQRSDVFDFWLRINHYESLHAHDAVAMAVKGIQGGYQV